MKNYQKVKKYYIILFKHKNKKIKKTSKKIEKGKKMLEMRYIRENSDKVKEFLKNRKSDFDLDVLLKYDEVRRNLLQEVEMLK